MNIKKGWRKMGGGLLIFAGIVLFIFLVVSIKQIGEYERGIKFLPIDLYKSHSTKFIMEEDGIRPPLNSIPGLGTVAAEGIKKAADEEEFECIDDLQSRGKVGKSVIELLRKFGCLEGMTQSNQMTLFM